MSRVGEALVTKARVRRSSGFMGSRVRDVATRLVEGCCGVVVTASGLIVLVKASDLGYFCFNLGPSSLKL